MSIFAKPEFQDFLFHGSLEVPIPIPEFPIPIPLGF